MDVGHSAKVSMFLIRHHWLIVITSYTYPNVSELTLNCVKSTSGKQQEAFLLTWINFNPSLDK